jgi:N6-L-threonylcarbamoyladenine synthase
MPGSGLILAIESSCDETAAAVVERGARTFLRRRLADRHPRPLRRRRPELASREHLRAIVPVVRAALAQANITLADLDAIAVTSGPGLAGALLVGITYAKALAFANNFPSSPSTTSKATSTPSSSTSASPRSRILSSKRRQS